MPLEFDPGAPPPADPAGGTPPDPEPSLAEHEAAFGDTPRRPEPDAEPAPEEDVRRPPRDTKTGQFKPQPSRHRAKSQAAGPADVPRIQELTKRLRDTEAERDALKQQAVPPATPVAPPAPSPPVPRGTDQAAAAPKPKIEQFQEYSDYVEALADWKIAEARRQDRETSATEAAARQVADAWRTKVDGAKTRYPDFEQVALLAPTTIPQGSLVDAWILEHHAGADVLYSLQKDPAELRRILALPLFDQVDALSLLAQRLSPTREPAVRTGAAATTPRVVAPRPPTPVRTSAMPATDEPPGDDASLADHEKYFGPKRR